jgi:nucleoside-diphosphate-sugar epimerase
MAIPGIVFTSSVAVYGFAAPDTDEQGPLIPFNDYGRTKREAEEIYRDWLAGGKQRMLTIVRPTVVFGPRNRGNVYNLLRQMASGRFAMGFRGKCEVILSKMWRVLRPSSDPAGIFSLH